MRIMRKKGIKTELTHVYATVNGHRQLMENKTAIESACIQENIEHFTQANLTSMMKEPMRSAVGLLPSAQMVQQILSGTFRVPETANRYVKAFF